MARRQIFLITTLAFLIQSTLLSAQISKGFLTLGDDVQSELAPNEHHQYKIELATEEFAVLRLLQQGVDVKITTYDPQGVKLNDFDSPNGKNGLELITIASLVKGDYVIDVSPFDENEPTGKYQLHIQSIKPKAVTPDKQVDELFTAWDSDDTPGASISIVKDGAIIYQQGYGMANLEYDIPITPKTIFHIASISKQFTVFAILLLEKEGKLHLDDDIRKYIPEVPDFGSTITLRHLASHTSGLRDQWNLLAMAGWRLDDVITKEHVMKLVSKQKELNFKPGEEYTYCNTGFTLLAEVVARVSGESFADFTHKEIFEPLGMTNTLFYDDHEKIVPNRAYSYYSAGANYKKSVLSYANVGATSLFTTAEDLSQWAMNFRENKVGDTTIIHQMNQLAVLNNGKTFGGALGQFVGKYKGLNEIQHGGADAGYRSYLSRFPSEDFSVMVLSNVAQFNPNRIAHQVADIYLKDQLEAESKKEPSESELNTDSLTIDPAILSKYVGEYELQPGFVITITEENGQLSVQATGQPILLLNPISTTEFKLEGVEAMIECIPNGEEPIKLIKLHQGGQIMDAPRLSAFDQSSIDLSEFAGEYYSEELSTSYQFTIEDEQLVAKHSRLNDFALDPIKEDVFASQVWYFGQTEFIRNEEGVVTGCKVTNGRVRNLHFDKID